MVHLLSLLDTGEGRSRMAACQVASMMISDNELVLVDNVLEPLVLLLPASSVGIGEHALLEPGEITGTGRRLTPAYGTPAAATRRQILEHGLVVAGQHLLQTACNQSIILDQ